MEAPQPILEASEVIVISAVGGSIRLPFNKCRLFIHHNKSDLAGRVRSICWSYCSRTTVSVNLFEVLEADDSVTVLTTLPVGKIRVGLVPVRLLE